MLLAQDKIKPKDKIRQNKSPLQNELKLTS